MSKSDKKSLNVKPRKMGRPPVGIPEDDAALYWKGITRWIEQRKLAQWLQDPEQWVEAQKALEQINLNTGRLGQDLNQWCQNRLSPEGWRRLQANIRQNRYLKGSASKTGDKQPRERVRAVPMKVTTAVDLKHYSESHNMTINQAINHLLKQVKEQQREVESFTLEHDRYVWRCSKCKYVVEAESEEKLRKLQGRHKFIDCKGDTW